jgi:hypothetical protein
MRAGKIAAWTGLIVGLGAVGLQTLQTVAHAMAEGASLPVALVYHFSFFTTLSNLGLALVYASEVLQTRRLRLFRRPSMRTMMAAAILLVMLYYHFVLTGGGGPDGVLDATVHYAAPTFYLAWWALAAEHGQVSVRKIPLMLVAPTGYIVYILIRGALGGGYPYDVLNAGEFGYPTVFMNIIGLLAGYIALCILMVWIDSALGRRGQLAE